MLYETLKSPPEENKEEQGKNTTHVGKRGDWDKRITLYRGLGLPEKAIQVYHDYLKKSQENPHDLKTKFEFTGFTSTSCVKEKGIMFAFQAGQKG